MGGSWVRHCVSGRIWEFLAWVCGFPTMGSSFWDREKKDMNGCLSIFCTCADTCKYTMSEMVVEFARCTLSLCNFH